MACVLRLIRQPFWTVTFRGLERRVEFEHANTTSCRNAKQNSEVDIYVPLCHTPLPHRIYICVISVFFSFIVGRVSFCSNNRL